MKRKIVKEEKDSASFYVNGCHNIRSLIILIYNLIQNKIMKADNDQIEHINNEVNRTLEVIKLDRVERSNPFFFTRVESRLKEQKSIVSSGSLRVAIMNNILNYATVVIISAFLGVLLGRMALISDSVNSGKDSVVESLVNKYNLKAGEYSSDCCTIEELLYN